MRGLRRSVRKRIRWGFIIIAVQLLLLCLCRVTVKQATAKKYESLLAEKEQLLMTAGRMVCITTKTVRAGERFTEDNVERRYALSEQEADTLAVDVIGTVARVDLPSGVILNTSVCSTEEYDVSERKCTFQGIAFSDCFEVYDVVDVRIRYGNGENYCVLKKKRLLPAGREGSCCFVLNETEQLMMSGAGFDTELYEGAELYLVGHLYEWEEGEVLSSFVPSEQVLMQLLELDMDNKVFIEKRLEFRKALEGRLAEHRKRRKDGVV